LQLCLAHLIRDVKALVDSYDKVLQNYGNKILTELKNLFNVIHRRDKYTDKKFVDELKKCKKAIIEAATGYVPMRSEAKNMAKRFHKHGKEYFTFITTPKVDPTNNCAEQAIRFVVMYRHVSQGTRSENGMIACERFFTVIASCSLQGKSAFDFIKETFQRYFNKLPAPTLVPLPEPST
ncbi:MAG: transposase, partial [Flavobacteriales bacterium]|nr:transposase [Flavobacteriales bacterium]